MPAKRRQFTDINQTPNPDHPTAIPPFKDTHLPFKDTHLPFKDTHLPFKDTHLPFKDTHLPFKDTHLPFKDTHLPFKDTHLPFKDTHLPFKDTHLRFKDTHLPFKDTHLPFKDTHLPFKDTHPYIHFVGESVSNGESCWSPSIQGHTPWGRVGEQRRILLVNRWVEDSLILTRLVIGHIPASEKWQSTNLF